ncbi:hypothetical protein [Pseudooceanicola sp. 200-1SW]|uniref:hypothetical protein n=1 Tax=Pseudooceanicola sp. 200-1SW TaxID=3425949 RepID=UPI003D7F69C0
MPTLARIDWAASTAEERLEALRRATDRQVCAMARAVEWERDTYEVIGWISAQICVDLGSALTLFLNAEPERFNTTPREAVPPAFQPMCAQLDALSQRINAGFYLPDPARKMIGPERLSAWLDRQAEEGAPGVAEGRWKLNPSIVAPMASALHYKGGRRKGAGREKSLLGRIISPLLA